MIDYNNEWKYKFKSNKLYSRIDCSTSCIWTHEVKKYEFTLITYREEERQDLAFWSSESDGGTKSVEEGVTFRGVNLVQGNIGHM